MREFPNCESKYKNTKYIPPHRRLKTLFNRIKETDNGKCKLDICLTKFNISSDENGFIWNNLGFNIKPQMKEQMIKALTNHLENSYEKFKESKLQWQEYVSNLYNNTKEENFFDGSSNIQPCINYVGLEPKLNDELNQLLLMYYKRYIKNNSEMGIRFIINKTNEKMNWPISDSQNCFKKKVDKFIGILTINVESEKPKKLIYFIFKTNEQDSRDFLSGEKVNFYLYDINGNQINWGFLFKILNTTMRSINPFYESRENYLGGGNKYQLKLSSKTPCYFNENITSKYFIIN